MKKISKQSRKGTLLFLAVIIAALLAGCMGGEDYSTYIDAVKKTEAITEGASQLEVVVESTFNETLLGSLSEADQSEIEKLAVFEFTLENHFNHASHQAIYDIYYFNNALGMDLKLYQKDQMEFYLKLPFMSDVYALDPSMKDNFDSPIDIQTFAKDVGKVWNTMLKAENIFIGEKTIIKNADGEIKSTKFTVKPTTAQLDIFLGQLRTEIINSKEPLLNYFNEIQIANAGTQLTVDNFEEAVNAIFNGMTIKKYEETAYMDLDGYLIDETITLEIEYASVEPFNNIFKNQTITIHTMKWDIERTQDLDFTILENTKILPMSEMEDWSVNP